MQFPVRVTAPVDELFTPKHPFCVPPLAPLPPTQFPVINKAPDEEFRTPPEFIPVPPVTFPTIDAVAGEAAVNCRQLREVVVDLLVTLAVSVTPLDSVNMPVPALLTSSQVVLTSIVTVWPVLARASSPTVGTTPPVHVAPAEKLPVAAEVMRAMA